MTVHRSKLLLVRKIVIITYLGGFFYNDARNTLPNLYIVSANVSITTKRLVAASFPNNKARDFEKCVGTKRRCPPILPHHTPLCAVILTISGRVICELSPEMSKAIRKHPPYYLPVTETPVSLWL